MKLRNVRRRQWESYLRHHMALTQRAAPYYVTDESGPFQAWPLAFSPGFNRMSTRDSLRRVKRQRNEWQRDNRIVYHQPQWEPADLPINAAGDTRPGFICTHELENGMGQCGSNVFDPDESSLPDSCIVRKGGPGW